MSLKKTFILALICTSIVTHFAPVQSWSQPTSLRFPPSVSSTKKSAYSKKFCTNDLKASTNSVSSPSALNAAASDASIPPSTDVPPLKFGPGTCLKMQIFFLQMILFRILSQKENSLMKIFCYGTNTKNNNFCTTLLQN